MNVIYDYVYLAVIITDLQIKLSSVLYKKR